MALNETEYMMCENEEKDQIESIVNEDRTYKIYNNFRNTRYRNKVRHFITDPCFLNLTLDDVTDDKYFIHLIYYITKLHKLGLLNRFTNPVTRDQIEYLWKVCVPRAFENHVHDNNNIQIYCVQSPKVNDFKEIQTRLIEGYCAYASLYNDLKEHVFKYANEIRIILLITNNSLYFANTHQGQLQWKSFEEKVKRNKLRQKVITQGAANSAQYFLTQYADELNIPPIQKSNKRKRFAYVVNDGDANEPKMQHVEQFPKYTSRARATGTKDII